MAELRPFEFCPYCSTSMVLVEVDGNERPTCPGCGYRQYGNPAPAANGVVVESDRILLVQRGREPFAGEWALPGGFVEWDEEPFDTAVREVLEETGLDVVVTGDPVLLLDTGDPRGNTLSANYPAVPADPDMLELAPGDDAADARWWPIDRIPPLAFENHRRALGALGIPGPRTTRGGSAPHAQPKR